MQSNGYDSPKQTTPASNFNNFNTMYEQPSGNSGHFSGPYVAPMGLSTNLPQQHHGPSPLGSYPSHFQISAGLARPLQPMSSQQYFSQGLSSQIQASYDQGIKGNGEPKKQGQSVKVGKRDKPEKENKQPSQAQDPASKRPRQENWDDAETLWVGYVCKLDYTSGTLTVCLDRRNRPMLQGIHMHA